MAIPVPVIGNAVKQDIPSQDASPESHPPQVDTWATGESTTPKLFRRIGDIAWSMKTLMTQGCPRDFYYYFGGIGDQILCTAVFRELAKRGHAPVTMMSGYPELFRYNDDVAKIIPEDVRMAALARRLRRGATDLVYGLEKDEAADTHPVPDYHIVARMCEVAGITGSVDIRPYLNLLLKEAQEGRVAKRQVAIVSSGLSARYRITNKQWYPERFQAVVDALSGRFDFVQLGDTRDPALDGALDLRGRTTLRQSAAVLSQSLLLVGHVGLMMHMARAVDCRSVVVYGGREAPFQTGYACNENLFTPLPCAPCWKHNACDYDRECMRRITPAMVAQAVERRAERHGTPLITDSYTLPIRDAAGHTAAPRAVHHGL